MTKNISFRFAILFLALSWLAAGCKRDEPPAGGTSAALPEIKPVTPPPFDAARAFGHLERQVAFGPRVPNTPAHDSALQYFKEQLGATTSAVQVQSFDSPGYDGVTLKLSNVLASFNPESTDRIMLLAHWDSRPWADEDPDSTKHKQGVPAANDGASGVGVLLEIARQLKEHPAPIGVDILLTDGEDYGISDRDGHSKYFIGSTYFVKNRPPGYSPRVAILLDLVGDKNAVFKKETFSLQKASAATNEIWQTAQTLGLKSFVNQEGGAISDDHLPFLEAGIPAVDIIDMDLVGHQTSDPDRKYWHTTDDLPKHLSPETLNEVGTLLLHLIYDRFPRTMRNF